MKQLLIFFLMTQFSLAFSQTKEDLVKKFMQERRKMMEQMINMFQDDFSGGDNFFSDDFDPFDSLKSFKGEGENIKIEEKYEKDGSISLVITPLKENITFDIKTEGRFITIKSESRQSTDTQDENGKVKSLSSRSFSRSISIPQGYNARAPVAEGKGLKISLIPTEKTKNIINLKQKIDDKKIPLGKQPGEQVI